MARRVKQHAKTSVWAAMVLVRSVRSLASIHAAMVHHAAVTSAATDHVAAVRAAMADVPSAKMAHLHRSMV
jgi:hypothetical protein